MSGGTPPSPCCAAHMCGAPRAGPPGPDAEIRIGSATGPPVAGVIIDDGSHVPASAGTLAVTLVAFATLLRVSEP